MGIKLTEKALKKAQAIGLGRLDLEKIIDRLIPFNHPMANRRYGNHLFLVANGAVLYIDHLDRCVILMVNVVCPDCNGDGGVCFSCDSTGKKKMYPADAVAYGFDFSEK